MQEVVWILEVSWSIASADFWVESCLVVPLLGSMIGTGAHFSARYEALEHTTITPLIPR